MLGDDDPHSLANLLVTLAAWGALALGVIGLVTILQAIQKALG